jgi:Capsule polysaccharide biosynthesis protein
MNFLFASIQTFESDFDGRVGAELTRLGHEVDHVTVSRRSARRLREQRYRASCLPDLIAELPPHDVEEEARRIEEQYRLGTIRDVYRTDPPSESRSEEWCVARTVAYFLALERLFDEVRPEVLVPEVGTELIRTVAHHVALRRGIPTFFLFYTIFPEPLRLYVDTMHAPIVSPEEVRELSPEERAEVESFISDFTARRMPIRPHRRVRPTRERMRNAVAYYRARLGEDRDNDYLVPWHWTVEHVRGWVRAVAARPLYRPPRRGRPFVYFPLHDTEDYKIKQVIPQFSDQASIVEHLADSLPPGFDLVLKEHPQSIGQNPLGLLRRLQRGRNVILVHPRTSTHDLIEQASAVAVISSTVGLEGLLHAKPVLTLGRPFYAGQGVTLDVDSLAELRASVPKLRHFRLDRERVIRFLHAAMARCRPGAPVLVDRSDENAVTLARTLDEAARALPPESVDVALLEQTARG